MKIKAFSINYKGLSLKEIAKTIFLEGERLTLTTCILLNASLQVFSISWKQF